MKFLSEINKKAWNIIRNTESKKGKVSKKAFLLGWKDAFQEAYVKIKCQMHKVNADFFKILTALFLKAGYKNCSDSFKTCYNEVLRIIRNMNNGIISYFDNKGNLHEVMVTWWGFNDKTLDFSFFDAIDKKNITVKHWQIIS